MGRLQSKPIGFRIAVTMFDDARAGFVRYQNSASSLTPITSRNAAMTVPSTRWRFALSGNCFASRRPSGLRKTKQMTRRTMTKWDKRRSQPCLGSGASNGAPAFFQAPKPPATCATGFSPISCAVLAASAERQPPAQKKTNCLSSWKTGLA